MAMTNNMRFNSFQDASAILAKEYGNINFLYEKDLQIDNYIKSRIKKMLDKL